jgi:rSAM/selenodomain-associated transferase 2
MISIIIPTFQEAEGIGALVAYLQKDTNVSDIIVADGGSTDDTVLKARQAGARAIICPWKGRASQMNAGAGMAVNRILYFLHADSYPPVGFGQDIVGAVSQEYQSGCYRLSFDYPHWFLRVNCWFTRFNIDSVRFGDQSLFITRKLFQKIGGFREDLIVMEDQEIINRIKRYSRFKVFHRAVTTSARKYRQNGIYSLQAAFFIIWFLYKLGASQEKLLLTYRRLIRQDKV